MPTHPYANAGLQRAGVRHSQEREAAILLIAPAAIRRILARRAEIQAEAAVRSPEEPAPPLRARDKAELAAIVYRLTGLVVSPVATCPGHAAPLDALAEAFFSTHRVTVWKASRGFGGKTWLLALLSHLESILLGAEITILAGSGQQSARVHAAQDSFWKHPEAPRRLLVQEPTTYETELTNGGKITALLASQRSARGPHPQRLRLDECDEIALPIFDAALGQTMTKNGIRAQTVMSSTHQYPDGTMTEILKRAAERGWPVREWCYRENLKPNGWLDPEEVEDKRSEITRVMWDAEYEGQEPSPGSRAIDTEAVEAMFREAIGTYGGRADEYIEVEAPVPGARYATGADWAKDKDWTIIITLRTDVRPWRLVAYLRTGRRPWPLMVEKFDDRVNRYPGVAAHDGTGLGDVVDDLLTVEATGVQLVGRRRADLLNEYVKEIERRGIISARIEHAYSEHKTATINHMFGTGHLPDSIAAGALAVYAERHVEGAWGAI